jgi:hypothetical protein
VIEIIGKTLAPFDDDQLIPAFGFGERSVSPGSLMLTNVARG